MISRSAQRLGWNAGAGFPNLGVDFGGGSFHKLEAGFQGTKPILCGVNFVTKFLGTPLQPSRFLRGGSDFSLQNRGGQSFAGFFHRQIIAQFLPK